ncbi:MAG: hypothetical protein ACLTK0_01215 [Anaerovoracaceae bacterium]
MITFENYDRKIENRPFSQNTASVIWRKPSFYARKQASTLMK